ncbi:CRISPR-associated protein Cse3 family [Vibrio ponticus]|nr:CRISPR-associated protein Cse3 family [Vibrio ponticus]
MKGREEIAQWFIERAPASWGFSVTAPQLQVEQVSVLQFEAKHRVTLQQAKLSGYLTVTNKDLFASSVANGIGRGRSFGCGLLQIVPVIESPLF